MCADSTVVSCQSKQQFKNQFALRFKAQLRSNCICCLSIACAGVDFGDDLLLDIEHSRCGSLACFHAWLVIGIDVDEACVEADGALKEGDKLADCFRCDFLNGDRDRLATVVVECIACAEEEAL